MTNSVKIQVFLASLLFLASGVSYAQPNIDSATREVDRDIRREVEKKMETRPKKPRIVEDFAEPERKPGEKTFFVRKINLIGVESVDPEAFRELTAKYENRENTVQDLNVLSRQVSREYLRHGIIAACVVPPQESKDGVFVLQAVEAHMGELEINDFPFFDKDLLTRNWMVPEGEVLNYYKMSRTLQLMNKNPDMDINATLHAGKTPETSNVVLTAKTTFPVHFTGNFDNEGSPSTGRERKTFGVRHNNFLGIGDTFTYGYTYGTSFTGNYFYHRVPFTNIGTSVMYGGSLSKAAPRKEYSVLGLSSRSEDGSVFVYQDIFKKDTYLGDIYGGIEAKDKTVHQIAGTTSRDRLRIVRAGGDLILDLFGGMTFVSPEISQGINGLGARRKRVAALDETPTSRDTQNTFTKGNLQVTHTQPLPWLGIRCRLNFEGQVSSEKMPSQEEAFLGGIDSVRGYPSGDFLADDAFQSNIEIQIPAFFFPPEMKLPLDDKPMKDRLTGVVFWDYAHGERKGVDTTTGEKNIVDLSGIGAGMRIRLYDQVSMRLEWGIPIGANRTITEAGRSRLHFSIVLEERLPEMYHRIKEEFKEKNAGKKNIYS